jgi:hypothetical protein
MEWLWLAFNGVMGLCVALILFEVRRFTRTVDSLHKMYHKMLTTLVAMNTRCMMLHKDAPQINIDLSED